MSDREWAKQPEEYVQGTPAWHAIRKKYITATDASSILGCSPWRSAYSLWCYKMGQIPDQETNQRMIRGMTMEPIAREAFESLTGIMMFPKVVFSEKYPWAMASLDGISIDGDEILEIKCASNVVHEMAKEGKLPTYYYAQVQHQLMVTGLERAHYYSYSGTDGALVVVPRDDSYIDKMIVAEKRFYKYIVDKTPPPLGDDDHTTVQVSATDGEIISRWLTIIEQIKNLKAEESDIRDKLCELSKGVNSLFCVGDRPMVRYTKFSKLATVDWASLCKEKGISAKEVDAYRRPSREAFRVIPVDRLEKEVVDKSEVSVV